MEIKDITLMNVVVDENEYGSYVCKFSVLGGTTNEFTFVDSKEVALNKIENLISTTLQGLELIQEGIRDTYGAKEDSIED